MAKALIAKVTINRTAPGGEIVIEDDDEADALVEAGIAEFAEDDKPAPEPKGKGAGN